MDCRLCGISFEVSNFNVELKDYGPSSLTYGELVEYHLRITLDPYKLYNQNICRDCQSSIDSICEFSKKVESVQNLLAIKKPPTAIQEVHVELEKLDASAYLTDAESGPDLTSFTYKKPHQRNGDEEKKYIHWTNDDVDSVDEIPSENTSKHRRKSMRQQDQTTIEEIYKNQIVPLVPLDLKISESDKLLDGEVLQTALDGLKLIRWTDLIKRCELCSCMVTDLIDLNNHQDKIHSVRELAISCPSCDNKFKRIYGFINHMISKHSEHLKHCCLLCDKVYIDLESLWSHVKSDHSSVKRQVWQCLACGQYRDSFTTLRKHNDMVHLKDLETSRDVVASSKSRRSKKIAMKVGSYAESGSEEEEVMSSEVEEIPVRKQARLSVRRQGSKSQIRNEIDSFEKLFADEIAGTSKQPCQLHLNVSSACQLSDGEVPNEIADQVSSTRWRDILSCGVCQIPFTSIDEMLKHVELKHNYRTKAFVCTACDGEFTAISETILMNHLVDRHFLEHLKFCCLYCSKMFYDLKSLAHHYKTHKGRFELNLCLWCGWYARTLDDLREHRSCHESSEKSANQMLCERVYKKFTSGDEPSIENKTIEDHEKNLDGSVTEKCQSRFVIDWSFGHYHCPRCTVEFTNPFDLFMHLRLKHPRDHEKKAFSCSLCVEKKEFSNLYTFVNHAIPKHIPNAQFCCIVCSKVHSSFVSLGQHYKFVHPAFPCVFCCHCGKIFMNVTIASSHFKSVNILRTPEERQLLKEGKMPDENSQICHICAKSFKSRGTLINHVKTHEFIEPSLLLQCHICSKFYKNKYKLQQHMVCHEDARSWKCKICGQAFNYKKLLQRHIQAVHQNERNFSCTFCEKRFNSKYDQVVHVRLHTGDFPYECPISECDSKYPAWSNLFKHCQSRHKLDIRSEGYKKLKATQTSQKSIDEFDNEYYENGSK